MDRYVIIKKTIKTKFDEFMDHGRILYFGAPCGFGKARWLLNFCVEKNLN